MRYSRPAAIAGGLEQLGLSLGAAQRILVGLQDGVVHALALQRLRLEEPDLQADDAAGFDRLLLTIRAARHALACFPDGRGYGPGEHAELGPPAAGREDLASSPRPV